MSELTISAEDYQAQIPGCQVGETIAVKAKITEIGADGQATAEVIPESIEKETSAEDAGENGEETAAAPVAPKKKKNPALAAAVGDDSEGMGY